MIARNEYVLVSQRTTAFKDLEEVIKQARKTSVEFIVSTDRVAVVVYKGMLDVYYFARKKN